MKHKVFVYGTLLKGYGNNRLLYDANFIGPATVKGTMYSFGFFPYVTLTEDQNTVHGEVYEVCDDILRRLDGLEGYHPSMPEDSFYNRTLVNTSEGEAFIYHIEYRTNDSAKRVLTGNWRLNT